MSEKIHSGQDKLKPNPADQALHDSERRLLDIVNFIPDATFAVDINRRVTYWNHAIEVMTGMPADQIVGKGDYEYSLPFYGARQPMLLDQILNPELDLKSKWLTFDQEGDGYIAEKFIPNLNGAPVFLRAKAMPLCDSEGKIVGAIESIRDISLLKKTEAELKQKLEETLLLNRVVAAVSSSLDPTTVLRSICTVLADAFHVSQAGIALFNQDHSYLVLTAEYVAWGGKSSVGALIPIEGNLATQYVAEKGEALAIADAQHDPRMETVHALMRDRHVVSMLLIPIVVHGEVIGTLGLDANQPREFTAEEIHFGQNAANAAGQALENARLHRAVQEELAERKRAQEALRESEERYRTLVENQGEGVTIIDQDGSFTFSNPAAEAIFGVHPGGLIGRNLSEFIDAWQIGYINTRTSEMHPYEKSTVELDIVRPDLERRTLIITVSPRFDEAGQYIGQFTVFRDNTDRKRAEEKLRYLSTHDILTGLYNRAFFEEELARLERSRQHPVSVIVMDVDGLKSVNDRFGHAKGDELLKRTAGVLTTAFRAEDIAARIGGDEFCVLLPNSTADVAATAIDRIRRLLEAQNSADPKHPLNLSIGASTGKKGEALTKVFKRADKAMYVEKAATYNQTTSRA
jgi:diguanylate cyclase (GGDEF)-like protein/PAS domain S-box-containing protein